MEIMQKTIDILLNIVNIDRHVVVDLACGKNELLLAIKEHPRLQNKQPKKTGRGRYKITMDREPFLYGCDTHYDFLGTNGNGRIQNYCANLLEVKLNDNTCSNVFSKELNVFLSPIFEKVNLSIITRLYDMNLKKYEHLFNIFNSHSKIKYMCLLCKSNIDIIDANPTYIIEAGENLFWHIYEKKNNNKKRR